VRLYDAPRVLSDRNLLGGAEAPADWFFDKYLAGFDKMRQLNPKKHCGRYGNIITAYFGHYLNGPVAAGDRIYIQSQCFLYCIGPAVKGAPGDDPRVVAEIRAESDLAKLAARLAAPSAQVRYETVLRLALLKKPLPAADAERLAALLLDDPYEEIRAEALLALEACDPKARAGWDCLFADLKKAYPHPPPEFSTRANRERRHWIMMTFRALGERGPALIARRWAECAQDPLLLKMFLDLATHQAWRIDGLVTAGLEVAQGLPLAKTPPWRNQVPCNTANVNVLPEYFAAIDAASDPATATILLKAYPKQWALYPTLARHLKPETLVAWIEPLALESSHPMHRGKILSAWKCLGRAALPSMERVRATVAAKTPEQDRLAADCAKAIDAAIAAVKGEPAAE